jgi:proteasome lid subunit RPN8/RPN11
MTDLSILTAAATKAAIQLHAVECFPKEACGIITADGFIALPNRHPDPENFFDCADDAAEYQIAGTLLAVVHSHGARPRQRVKPNYPSSMDMRQQAAMNVPWGLCVSSATMATKPWFWGPGIETPPLVERVFRHGPGGSDGRGDCFALIKDYYQIAQGIELPDFPRDWEWWLDEDADLYEHGFREAGFEPVRHDDVRIGDVGLVASPVVAADGRALRPRVIHGAIYVGEQQVLHHKAGRLSMIEPLHSWNHMVKYWVRHASKR